MKKFILALLFFTGFNAFSQTQNFTGQWKGDFMDQSTKSLNWGGDRCEYVLDLECKGKKVTGFSYTYFTDGGKKYYTICKLEGKIDTRNKYVEVKEIERTKTNVPANISNCFQVHKLTLFKQTDGTETLEGNWVPAPNQKGDCGYGLTMLSRRTLKPNYRTVPVIVQNNPRTNPSSEAQAKKTNASPLKSKQSLVTNPRQNSSQENTMNKESITTPILTPDKSLESIKETNIEKVFSKNTIEPSSRFEKRSNTVLRTIVVETSSIKIDLYDNGEVDGDSVSLFLNGKLIMAHQRLTTQPLSLTISMEDLQDKNELVMYADNLGTFPPNTALMIVTDGNRRYEVRITSDLQKSGTILFVKKGK